jgi:hypothetical protein
MVSEHGTIVMHIHLNLDPTEGTLSIFVSSLMLISVA